MADLVAAGLRPVVRRAASIGPPNRGRPAGAKFASRYGRRGKSAMTRATLTRRRRRTTRRAGKGAPEEPAPSIAITQTAGRRGSSAGARPAIPGRRGPHGTWAERGIPAVLRGRARYDGLLRRLARRRPRAAQVEIRRRHSACPSCTPNLMPPRATGAAAGQFRERSSTRDAESSVYILVGRSIESDVATLHKEGWLLAGVGTAVLAAGLIGGFWFSRRAIKPIEAISAAAAEISLSNLSRRIDVSGTETELTGLARTLNQMIDRLESAFSQQVRFTADASHELRTPLAVILSHAELALDKTRPAHELRETIETCRRSALRMKSVVESLLTLARFDSGELQLECRPVDLSRIVGDCVGLVRSLAEKRRIAIELDLESAGLVADSDRISQVVMNLLTNAIRYNHDDGRVSVTTRSSKGEVILNISDTGIGIGPEHLPHIFERFYRVDKARSRKDGGIGLGLAICRSIVEAHGGQITVTSVAEGGSQFEVRLPKRGAPIPEEKRDSEESRLEVVAISAKG